MTKNKVKTMISAVLCTTAIIGNALTVNAEGETEIANTPDNMSITVREGELIPGVTPEIMNVVTQTTPGGINIYGYEPTGGVNPFTGELLCCQWHPEYLAAIDAMGVTNEMSQYDKCVTIANYLCDHIEYATGDQIGHQFGYMALKDGTAVCGGYVDAFQNICLALGIECQYIGSHEKMNHGWNEVYIDGTTYYVDVTWMDTGSRSKEYLMSTTLWPDHIGGEPEHIVDINMFEQPYSVTTATNELDGSEVSITYTPGNQ